VSLGDGIGESSVLESVIFTSPFQVQPSGLLTVLVHLGIFACFAPLYPPTYPRAHLRKTLAFPAIPQATTDGAAVSQLRKMTQLPQMHQNPADYRG
jgi:hypothetical protein